MGCQNFRRWARVGAPEQSASAILSDLNQLLPESGFDGTDQSDRLTDLLAALAALDDVPDEIRRAATVLSQDKARRQTPYLDGSGFVASGSRNARLLLSGGREIAPGEDLSAEFTDEDVASVLIRQVTLRHHGEGVRDNARRFAAACRLPQKLMDDLALAAWLHDLGKADPRFQLLLHRGDEIAMVNAEDPLAKS